MPIITHLTTEHYKNLYNQDLAFCSGLNVLAGPNGAGKTNLLDAIFMLCFTKSAFSLTERQVVQNNHDYYALEGQFRTDDTACKVRLAYQNGRGKLLKVDGTDQAKLAEHLGRLPVVFFTPSDTDYVRGDGKLRRKFFDSLIAQYDKTYLSALSAYNALLAQRNKHLKETRGRPDGNLIEVYDQQLTTEAKLIFAARNTFTEEFSPLVEQHYDQLCQRKEQVGLSYSSALAEADLGQLLKENLRRDCALLFTSVGVQRDDWRFKLQGRSLKKLGSQGQQKSFAIALQLARRDLLNQKLHQAPIVLLDDVFGKLDDQRMENLLELLTPEGYQIFLTDARPLEAKRLMGKFCAEKAFYRVENGKITPE